MARKEKEGIEVGEVSMVNIGIIFMIRQARFPEITEDEKPVHLLVNDYAKSHLDLNSKFRKYMSGKIIVSGVGCRLVDLLYNDIDFRSDTVQPFLLNGAMED